MNGNRNILADNYNRRAPTLEGFVMIPIAQRTRRTSYLPGATLRPVANEKWSFFKFFDFVMMTVSNNYKAKKICEDHKIPREVFEQVETLFEDIDVKDVKALKNLSQTIHLLKVELNAEDGLLEKINNISSQYFETLGNIEVSKGTTFSQSLRGDYHSFTDTFDEHLCKNIIDPLKKVIEGDLEERNFTPNIVAVYYLVLKNAFDLKKIEPSLYELISASFDKIKINILINQNKIASFTRKIMKAVDEKNNESLIDNFSFLDNSFAAYCYANSICRDFIFRLENHSPLQVDEEAELIDFGKNFINNLTDPILTCHSTVARNVLEFIEFLEEQKRVCESHLKSLRVAEEDRSLSLNSFQERLLECEKLREAYFEVERKNQTKFNFDLECLTAGKRKIEDKISEVLKVYDIKLDPSKIQKGDLKNAEEFGFLIKLIKQRDAAETEISLSSIKLSTDFAKTFKETEDNIQNMNIRIGSLKEETIRLAEIKDNESQFIVLQQIEDIQHRINGCNVFLATLRN